MRGLLRAECRRAIGGTKCVRDIGVRNVEGLLESEML